MFEQQGYVEIWWYVVSPFWDQGYVEDLIETFGLNLVVKYFSNYTDRIEELMYVQFVNVSLSGGLL